MLEWRWRIVGENRIYYFFLFLFIATKSEGAFPSKCRLGAESSDRQGFCSSLRSGEKGTPFEPIYD
jgi:hypothetical protein